MTTDYSDHYTCDEEWLDGRVDCDPPEPGKIWLTIREDGEEIAIIVLRTDARSRGITSRSRQQGGSASRQRGESSPR